jgi:3-keto-5-aminohexanoate cleavage enzyme
MDPVIITCAITGAEVTKEQQPGLPITPKEQGKAAKEAVRAGASVIHLHVREDDGSPSQRVERFEEVIQEIRYGCPDVILQISTGGAVGESIENRLAPLELRPEMATLNLGSMNFGDDVFLNTPQDIKKLADEIYNLDIIPELEVYDTGMLEMAARYLKEGLLQTPLHFQFVLGVPGGMSGDPSNLEHLLNLLKSNFTMPYTWGVAGIGRFEFPLAEQAAKLGGNIRVGFEDNIYIEKGKLAKSNAELVKHAAKIVKNSGRKIANCDEARKILELG